MKFSFLENVLTNILIKNENKKVEACYRLIEKIQGSNNPEEIDELLYKLSSIHFWIYSMAEPVFDKRRELCLEKIEPIIMRMNKSSDIDEIRDLYHEASYWASWGVTSKLSDLINNSLCNKIKPIINQMSEIDDADKLKTLYSGVMALTDCLPKSKIIELHTLMYDRLQTKANNLLSQLKECDISEELTILYKNISLILVLLIGTSIEKDLSKSLSNIMDEKKSLAINRLKESNNLEEIDLSFRLLWDRYSSLSREEQHEVAQSLIDKIDFIIGEIKTNDSLGIYRTETTVLMIQPILPEDKKRELNNALILKAEEIVQNLNDSNDINEIKELFLKARFMYHTINSNFNNDICKQLEDKMIKKINFIINLIKESTNQEERDYLLTELAYLVNILPPLIRILKIPPEVSHLLEDHDYLDIDQTRGDSSSSKTKRLVMK